MSEELDLEQLFDAAELPQNSVTPDKILYVGFSVQRYRELPLLKSCTNLKIAVFRMCNFAFIPREFFDIPTLESMDLTGNMIESFDKELPYGNLPKLRHMNLTDNRVKDIVEVGKLSNFEGLKHLVISGNICLSAHDSFNRIVTMLPNLLVLNESIIMSQHRGFLDGSASFDTLSTLPVARTDDYIFYFVKYMRGGVLERYWRRLNTDFFCLHKVLRRNSNAVRVQSIYRGYRQRMMYKEMRNAALTIEKTVRRWYENRMKAAGLIQCKYLHFMLKKRIRKISKARRIQANWRKCMGRKEALVRVFENEDESADIYLMNDGLTVLSEFCASHGFGFSENVTESDYIVVRMGEIVKRSLPGSPIVFYNINSNVIIRRRAVKVRESTCSIWCGHDHCKMQPTEKVSSKGVNYSEMCPFASVKCIPVKVKRSERTDGKPPGKRTEYPRLMMVHFDKSSDLKDILTCIVRERLEGVVLFPKSVIVNCTAQITLHSCLRAFVVRKHMFKNMKRVVLEARALANIRYCLKTRRLQQRARFVMEVAGYYRQTLDTNKLFIRPEFTDKIASVKISSPINFGYTSDRLVSLETSDEEQDKQCFLTRIFPEQEKIAYRVGTGLSSLLRVETIVIKASIQMLSIPVSENSFRRLGLLRITFGNPTEAINRATVYAYATGDFSQFMTERDVERLCAAECIAACWRGFSERKRLRLIAAQKGVTLTLNWLFKNKNVFRSVKPEPQAPIPEQKFMKLVHSELPPSEAIHNLRGDYRPWESNRPKKKKYIAPPLPSPHQEEEVKERTVSMKQMGLVDEIGALAGTGSMAADKTRELSSTHQHTKGHTFALPKPTYHEHKPVKVAPEFMETERIFAKPLLEMKADPYWAGMIPLEERLANLPDNEAIQPMMRPRTVTSSGVMQKQRPPREIPADENHGSPPSREQVLLEEQRQKTMTEMRRPRKEAIRPVQAVTSKLQEKRAQSSMLKTTEVEHTRQERSPRITKPVVTGPRPTSQTNRAVVEGHSNAHVRATSGLDNKAPKVKVGAFVAGDMERHEFAGTSLEADDALFDSASMRPRPSSQFKDKTLEVNVRRVFARLLRLRQIAIAVEQSMIVDTTIEEKRAVAVEVQRRERLSRLTMLRDTHIKEEDARERGAIERRERLEKAKDLKQRTQENRSAASRAVRTAHTRRRTRQQKEKEFAAHFVSVSRQVSQICETRHRKREENKIFGRVQAAASSARQDMVEQKERHRSTVIEIMESRLEAVKADKTAVEDRRKFQKQQREARMEAIREWKKQEKEIMQQAKEQRVLSTVIYTPGVPSVEVDEVQSAMFCLEGVINANLGGVECRMICEMIAGVVFIDD